MTGKRLTCEWCGTEFARSSSRGPEPRYCSHAHRQRAHEARQAFRVAKGSLALRDADISSEPPNPGLSDPPPDETSLVGVAMPKLPGAAFVDAFKAFGAIQADQDWMTKKLGAALAMPKLPGAAFVDAFKAFGAIQADQDLLGKKLGAALAMPKLPGAAFVDAFKAFGAIQADQDLLGKKLGAALAMPKLPGAAFVDAFKAFGAIQAEQDLLGKKLGAALAMPNLPGAAFVDAFKALGAIQTKWEFTAAVQAHKSAAILEAILPSSAWLEAASQANALSGIAIRLRSIAGISNGIAARATDFAERPPVSTVGRRSTRHGVTAWNSLVDNTTIEPSPRELERLALQGSSALSIVEAVAAISAHQDLELLSPGDYVVVERADFGACIAALGQPIVARWEGAWERVVRPGPDAASQAAHSLVELIDQSLRKAAPDQAVLEWHRAGSRSASELHNGRPTRGVRLRYLVRGREADVEGAEIFIDCLLALTRLLQKKKHADGDNERLAVARLIPGIESILYFVLGYPSETDT